VDEKTTELMSFCDAGHAWRNKSIMLLIVCTHCPMWCRKCYRTCALQYAWSLSIEVAVNFRACVRSELLKWIGWHLGWH